VIKQHEVQIEMILRHFLRRGSAKRAECPNEERLAGHLDGTLTEAERQKLESHLASCTLCLDDLVAAYRTVQEGRDETVPQRALEKAMTLMPQTCADSAFFELVVRLFRDSLDLVSTTGRVVLAAAPAEVRGKGKISNASIVQVEKKLEKFTVTVEAERTEENLCQVAVNVRSNAGSVVEGIRLSLISGGREAASYLARQGTAIFDRIGPGDYLLEVSEAGHSVGTIGLTIKGGLP
jgi:Putative zinc-finger